MDQDATDVMTTDDTATATDPVEPTETADDELLIEEISIDGMCGVY